MITAKINLAKFKHAFVKGKEEGETIICIPVKANNLFKSEKGNIFLDLIAFELLKGANESGDTHLVKQSLNKEAREAMSEEEQKAIPILGNMKITKSGGEQSSQSEGEFASTDNLPF